MGDIALLRELVRTETGKERGLQALNALFLLGNVTTADLNTLDRELSGCHLCVALNGITREHLSDEQVARVVKRLKNSPVSDPCLVPWHQSTAFRLGIVEEGDFDTLQQIYVSSVDKEGSLVAVTNLWYALGCHSRKTM